MRTIEIFSAGCALCNDAISEIKEAACTSCNVVVLDMNDIEVTAKAKSLGVKSVPAVAIDGKLAQCCEAGGVDIEVLKSLGLGKVI